MANPTLSYIIFADKASREVDTSKWTLSGIFDSIKLKFPDRQKANITPEFVTLFKIRNLEIGNREAVVNILKPDKKSSAIKANVSMTTHDKDVSIMIKWPSFPVSKDEIGNYTVKLEIDGQEIKNAANFPLKIMEVENVDGKS